MLALRFGRNLSAGRGRFTCAPRRRGSLPESNFLIRVAPCKPAKLVPFQTGANTGRTPLLKQEFLNASASRLIRGAELSALSKHEFRALGEYSNSVPGVYLAGGHQTVERILELAGQGVLEVGSTVLRIAAVMKNQGFGAGGDFKGKGVRRMLDEDPAGPRELKVQDFLQVRGTKRVTTSGRRWNLCLEFLNFLMGPPLVVLYAVEKRETADL